MFSFTGPLLANIFISLISGINLRVVYAFAVCTLICESPSFPLIISLIRN